MQLLYSSAALISILASRASAAPGSPADLVPRACQTRPPTIYQISAATPDITVPADNTQVQRTGPPYKDSVSSVLVFDGFGNPATGCQLRYSIPAGNGVATANPDYSNAFQADVWLVKPGYTPTWNNPPVKDQMVGTIQLPTKPTNGIQTTLWAGNCPPGTQQLRFLVEGSDWQQLAGSARLNQSANSGFSVVFNC